MRTVKLQTQISIDGYMATPEGGLDWMTWTWDDQLKQFVKELHIPVDLILLGRKMSEGFVPYWKDVVGNPQHPEYELGRKMHDTPKVIFSKTVRSTDWENTTMANGDLADEIKKLKNQKGGDIILYGGSEFVSSMIKENLVDDYYLFVNPTAIGKGLPVFTERKKMELIKAYSFDCGIVVLNYKPAK